MSMLPVPVLFLVSRARDSCGSFARVETLKTLQAFRSSTRKQGEKFRPMSSCEERKG